ncbi:hypothetical protein [uncultured Maribacter sp.]|uniref:hypothetical protein n=1 Tax=uncultured Maribacter sp. TaxID=431308 RepID=UPI0030EC65C5
MFRILTLVYVAFIIVSCSNDNEKSKEDCGENTACTQNYKTIGVTIKDSFGVKIVLDSYTVIDMATKEDLTISYSNEEFENYRDTGYYPIFSDAFRVQYQNSKATISFKGYISDNEVVTEDFIVGADCCHVRRISGNTEIVLD